MNDQTTSLFEGQRVRLAPRDSEHDPEIEAQWTHDPEYLHTIQEGPAIPYSPAFIKKRYEEDAKEKNQFIFALRTLADDRLIGFAALRWIEWTHAYAELSLGIGKTEDCEQDYDAEALQLILGYAFTELNFHGVRTVVYEYDEHTLRLFERAGFQLEVRRRQAIHRDGRRWDVLHLGLLRDEWEKGYSHHE